MRPKWILVAPLLALWFAGQSVPTSAQGGPERGGTMRYSSTKLIKALEPITTNSLATLRMTSLIFEGLLRRDEFGIDVEPLLAESFEATPRLITFKLRRDVTWHDGYPFTAHDVYFTYKLVTNPKTETALRDEFKFIQSVSVIDDYTVTFTFAHPVYRPEHRLLPLKILPRHQFSIVEPGLDWKNATSPVELRFDNVPLRSAPQEKARITNELPNKCLVKISAARRDWYKVKVIGGGPVGATGWIPRYKSYLSRKDGSFLAKPIGTGPYQFEGITVVRGIQLKANTSYYRKPPYIEYVRRTRTHDKNTMVNLLIQEILNLLPETPLEDVARIEQSGTAQTIPYSSLKFSGFAYNNLRPPLDRIAVRRAMTMGLDREQLLETFYQGQGEVIAGPFAPESWGVSLGLKPLPYDPDKATELLDKAVGPAGASGQRSVDGQPVQLKLIVSNEHDPADFNMCHAYKDAMGKLGISVEVETLDKGKFIEKLISRDFDIAYIEWNFGYSYNVKPIFHPDGVLNYAGYRNDEVKEIIERMDAENDPQVILDLANRLQTIIAEEAPYTFLWTLKNVASASLSIKGIGPETIDPYEFFTWIEAWYIPRDQQ